MNNNNYYNNQNYNNSYNQNYNNSYNPNGYNQNGQNQGHYNQGNYNQGGYNQNYNQNYNQQNNLYQQNYDPYQQATNNQYMYQQYNPLNLKQNIYNQQPAEPKSRIISYLIDALIYGIPYMIFFYIAGIIGTEMAISDNIFQVKLIVLLQMIIQYGVAFIYCFVLYIVIPIKTQGYTIGKRFFSVKIKKVNGHPVDLSTMLLRELVGKWLLGGLSLGVSHIVSIIFYFTRKDRRTVHDLIAGTYVVEE